MIAFTVDGLSLIRRNDMLVYRIYVSMKGVVLVNGVKVLMEKSNKNANYIERTRLAAFAQR
jgi:hypothetical protein